MNTMKNVVTPETARKMKEAGYPQPDPEPGQVWYIDETPIFITGVYKTTTSTDYWYSKINGTQFHEKYFPESAVFAPTATDILKELSVDYALVYAGNEPTIISTVEKRLPFLYKHKNPAEACALAWLQINTK